MESTNLDLAFYTGFIYSRKNQETSNMIILYQTLNDILIDMIVKIVETNKNSTSEYLFRDSAVEILHSLFDTDFTIGKNMEKLMDLNKKLPNNIIIKKINLLINIITNPFYKISNNNDYNERCMYFFSRFIPIYIKMDEPNNTNPITKKIVIIDQIINQLNSNKKCDTITKTNRLNTYWTSFCDENEINHQVINTLTDFCDKYNTK